MRRLNLAFLISATAMLAAAAPSWATGILVPTDKSVDCLSIVYQRLNIEIREQAAITKVQQEFRNHTNKPLEAYYLFPLPKDAGVKNFAMWVDGKKVEGEVVEADKARTVYEDVVRRLKDPGLLEHMGQNLWRVRVYPIPANGTQKIEISYSELVPSDAGVAEYRYPLRAGNKAFTTEKDFTVNIELHSQVPLKSVYSPSHDVDVDKKGDHQAIVSFEQSKYPLNRDFSLFWTVSEKDVGLSTLFHRKDKDEKGYFLALISPPSKPERKTRVPRDIVFVVDTSGSMKGEKIEQAKGALKFCLNSLDKQDRFAIVEFSTTATEFSDELKKANEKNINDAIEWGQDLSAQGGTAIDDALKAAFKFRPSEARNFTIVFLTDGLPTIGETNVGNILKNLENRNSSTTRIFAFGVGDDVNTHLLDQLANQTRATSVYVRADENIESKVSSFYSKISHPVLTDLSLKLVGDKVKLLDIFPPQLPDLFHGSQLTVLGRYTGNGDVAVRLSGTMGEEDKTFDYEVKFPKKESDHDFVAGIWARRKVGYLLDQIRINGEKSELVDEVVRLAKDYGIATPYTSYLVVPGEPQLASAPERRFGLWDGTTNYRQMLQERSESLPRLRAGSDAPFGRGRLGEAQSVQSDSRMGSSAPAAGEDLVQESTAGKLVYRSLARQPSPSRQSDVSGLAPRVENPVPADALGLQSGKQAVDVAQQLERLKTAGEAAASASRTVDGVRFLSVGGVWVDQRVKDGSEVIAVQYLGQAYFKLLELRPELNKIFSLGDHVLFLTPSGHAVFIGPKGADEVPEETIKQWLQASD